MISKYKDFLKVKEEEKERVNYLIELFDKLIQFLKEFYSLKLNKRNEGKIRHMILEKVTKFADDYVYGKLRIIINRLVN